MSKVRVYELAKEFGLESKEIIAKLEQVGEYVKSASSTIEAPVVRKLHAKFPELKEAAVKAAAKESSEKGAAIKKTTAKKAAKAAAEAAAAEEGCGRGRRGGGEWGHRGSGGK